MHRIRLALVLLSIVAAACERQTRPLAELPPCDPGRAAGGSGGAGAVTAVPVEGSLFMLAGRGGNIGASVGPDGVLLVDAQFADVADDIRAALAGLKAGKITYVLNTHHHPDHTGGNPMFGGEATLVAHDHVRRRLVERGMEPAGLPVVTFSENMSIHFNGEEIRAAHFANGHTDGDLIVFFTGSNVVHAGDHFFNGRFPFVDLDAGGDVEKYRENVDALLEMLPPGARIIPGHGELAGADDLRRYRDMLVETTAHVRQQMDAKRPLEAIVKAGLPKKWAGWGAGFINEPRWIETIHASLSRSR